VTFGESVAPGIAGFVWEWNWQRPLLVVLTVVELGYIAVWAGSAIRGRRAHPSWTRLALFTSGLVAIALGIMSPIGANDERLLSMHMLEHDLLIWTAAPLLALGGLPLLTDGWRLPDALRRSLTFLTGPVVAWTISTVLLWGWHSAPAYGLALSNEGVHIVEHICLLVGSLLYWWPLIAPPATIGGLRSNAARAGYLLAGAMQSALLGALITFHGSVLYAQYLRAPGATVSSALADQQLAGALMWYPGAFVFAVAATLVIRGSMSEPLEST
jgi:cytochrome c oxidase assembly factor CtaG